ncbi:5-formyltetrahydrofolate cyclo-ligase [Tilletiaria anomala UBC 951]|uniref:5-formyltetrahydrofolate cyclo-ligase n=1 Tax=Tilletiaria anomala (strain ATCC 24038 / CBS 436.72 / UBC 951) TaxID=1037660 RepID=A0A066VTF4_TILAU|nr:5-formyltetrahydrofolate cyclo-ligase [Tilletiaria anomala UBC 951]KDN44756.1 5-formyltetrahydrofolate cyclo-ligase [Tilletiaria anomala UBC 951]
MSATLAPHQTVRQRKRVLRKAMAAKLSEISAQDIAAQSSEVSSLILNSDYWAQAQTVSIYVNMKSGEIITDQLCTDALKQGKKLYVPLFASPASTSEQGKETADAGAAVFARSKESAGLLGQAKLTPHSAPTPPTTSASTNGQAPPVAFPGPLQASKTPPTTGQVFASDMRMLRIRSQQDFEDMKTNRWGIREPLDYYAVEGDVSEVEPQRREDALEQSTGGNGLDLILAPGVAFDAECGRLGHGKGYYDRYISRTTAFNARNGRRPPAVVALALQEQILPERERVPADEDDVPITAVATPSGWIKRSP